MAASGKMKRRKSGTCCAGHDVSDAGNLYVRSDGYTECKACKRDAQRRLRFDNAMRQLMAVKQGAVKIGAKDMIADIDNRLAMMRARLDGDSEDDVLDRQLAAKVAGESDPAYVKRKR